MPHCKSEQQLFDEWLWWREHEGKYALDPPVAFYDWIFHNRDDLLSGMDMLSGTGAEEIRSCAARWEREAKWRR